MIPPGTHVNPCDDGLELYRRMLLIRLFEERLLESFTRGLIFGTTHTAIGQEADGVGVLSCSLPGDVVVSNHRGHGHFLAYGAPMHALAAEMMGRRSGVCRGRGGSQHLHWGDFYASGILGGTVPLAVGMALAERERGTHAVVIAFLGDGTLGEGVVYESLNLAALWKLPVVFIVENNRYAQSTPIEQHLAGSLPGRFAAFGIPALEQDTTDVLLVRSLAQPLIDAARSGAGPQALILHTYRFSAHSKGDDTRDPQEIARYRQKDPLPLHAARLEASLVRRAEQEAQAAVEEAFRAAEAEARADPGELTPALGDRR
jgi:TPP-dependent pyruvate/acetoin dehydrogenase alpha subunit